MPHRSPNPPVGTPTPPTGGSSTASPPGHRDPTPDPPYTFRGKWFRLGANSFWYRGDAVHHKGELYICTEDLADPGIQPSNHWKWNILEESDSETMRLHALYPPKEEHKRQHTLMGKETSSKEEPEETRRIGRIDELLNQVEDLSRQVRGNASVTNNELERKLDRMEQDNKRRRNIIEGQREEIRNYKKEIKNLKFNLAPPPPRNQFDPEDKCHRCEGCGWGIRTKNAKVVPMVPKGSIGQENASEEPYVFCSNKCVSSYLRGGGRQMTIGSRFSIYYDKDHHHYIEEVGGRDAVPVIHDNRLLFVGREASVLVLYGVGGLGILALMAISAIASAIIW